MGSVESDERTLFNGCGLTITEARIVWRGVEIGLNAVASAETGRTYRAREIDNIAGGAVSVGVVFGLAAMSNAFSGVGNGLELAAAAFVIVGIATGVTSAFWPRRGLHVRTKTGDELWLLLEGFAREDRKRVANALKAAPLGVGNVRSTKPPE